MLSSILHKIDTQTHRHTHTDGNPRSGEGSQNLCQTTSSISQEFDTAIIALHCNTPECARHCCYKYEENHACVLSTVRVLHNKRMDT